MKNLLFKRWASMLIVFALSFQILTPVTFAMENGDVASDAEEEVMDEILDEVMEELEEEVDGIMEELEDEIDEIVEEIEEEIDLSDVDSDDAVEVLEDVLDEEENADDEIDEIVEELLDDVDNDEEAEELIEDVGEDVEEAIAELEEEAKKASPARRMEIAKKILQHKAFLLRLRAKLIKKHVKLAKTVKRVKQGRHLYQVRWGVLGQRDGRRCPGLDRDAIKSALDAGETPKCDVVKADYEGSIGVNKGELKVKKLMLFEGNDEMLNKAGEAVEWTSHIAGHWDGFVVEYMPSDEEGDVKVTLSIGDVDATFSPSEVMGRKAIGNGHHVEVKPLAAALSGVTDKVHDKLVQNKVELQDKVAKVQDRLRRVHLLKGQGSDDVSTESDELEEILEEIEEYNFDDISADEIGEEVEAALEDLDDGTNKEKIKNRLLRLRRMLASIKTKAKNRKFDQKIIPFKDTDDSEWYTEFVAKMKDKKIVSGFKDANGNDIGEYRPGNNVTIAEILKIGLETSNNGDSEGTPNLRAALNHWAKAYVKRAEELDLDIVGDGTDLNRPATRGEVIRMMLEAAGIEPDAVSSTKFSDVAGNHKHAAFIALAEELGIVSGDDGASTFRPDASINRAEVAKIANQILEVLVGE